MRKLCIAVVAIFLVFPVFAKELKTTQKIKTLKDLIDLTLQKGISQSLGEVSSEKLDFERNMFTKAIGYLNNSDGYARRFHVVLDETGINPVALVFVAGKLKRKNKIEVYEMREFRTDLKGELVAAAKVGGQGDDIFERPIGIEPKVTRQFKKDLRFFLQTIAVRKPDLE